MQTDPTIPLTLERVAIDYHIGNKQEALERISSLLAGGMKDLEAPAILRSLLARERLGSTGLGQGAALPHARLGRSGQVAGALLSLPQGVNFEATDGGSVYLVFGLLVPEDATGQHLAILARLASAFRDSRFTESLRTANSQQALFERLTLGITPSA